MGSGSGIFNLMNMTIVDTMIDNNVTGTGGTGGAGGSSVGQGLGMPVEWAVLAGWEAASITVAQR